MHDLERICTGLADGDPAVRLGAAAACEAVFRTELEGSRADWEPVVVTLLPALMRAIGDRHKGVQVHAAECLQFLAYQSGEVTPALRQAMSDPDAWRAWGAAIVAARLGCWFPEMDGALSGAMGAEDRDVRWAAAGFSLQLGRSHPEAVSMAVAALRSENPLARKMAAYCLGAMGEYAEVESPLAERLADPDRDVRRAAILALDKLPHRSPEVKVRIAALHGDPDEFVRRTAAAVAAKV
jgi:hypothetical protein